MLFVDGGVASSEILAIAVSRESNTWDSLRTILTDKTLLQDWGPFKNQHTIWNLHLLGKLRIANPEQWGDMASWISDRATTELPQRFWGDLVEKCSTSPAKKRKSGASEKCPTSLTSPASEKCGE